MRRTKGGSCCLSDCVRRILHHTHTGIFVFYQDVRKIRRYGTWLLFGLEFVISLCICMGREAQN
jgi:uncharacterized membrane protein